MASKTRNQRPLKERYPVFFAFGEEPIKFLDEAEAIAATPQERIRSVWPFLVKAVIRFSETLRPRERANFDPEDVLTEVYVKLMEKDCKWSAARGRYLSFAAKVVANEFHRVRDRTRTVKSPRNTYSRLREYEAEEAADTISPQRCSTLGAIRRVLTDAESLDAGLALEKPGHGPDDEAERREDMDLACDAVMKAVSNLDAEEASFIGYAYGLWGQPEVPLAEIASARGHTREAVKAAQHKARAKMREHLERTGHPVSRD